ncbi:MAG TPA: family 20 glycosylhydrolase [Vicinamibacterales bacterium]|nr:family 20 glycosylhydrolase [Vicinamibacterales bacterium]
MLGRGALLTTLFALASFPSFPSFQAPQAHSLMPVPASIAFTPGRVPISTTTTIAVTGAVDPRLYAAADRVMRRLEKRTGLTMSRAFATEMDAATFVIRASAASPKVPSLDEDESYSLTASGSQVRVTAPTTVGAMRGLETLLQLVSGDREGFFIPGVQIQDRPRFKWRGLLIDAGRHFEPVAVIKRQLDAMAAVKLNVLHFHLSEDQGFRVESRKFPKLHELGSDGDYYTQAALADIIDYAAGRGIRVVPEFDMPGHVTSWVVGHPELASAPGPYQIERKFGVFEAAFDPTKESTYKFIDTFIGEMVKVFPDPYWHIGGDENNGKQWAANPAIQDFMKKRGLKDAHALQTYFNQRLLEILKKHKKRMMGWDEVFQPGLPKETVVHSWRGQKSLFESAKQGYDGVLSAGYYIDLLEPASRHYAVDPLPAGSGLTDAEAAHILGGEATMWGEWVGPETVESRIWPRTAAIAERFWSPREVADVDDMYRRLDRVSITLEELGLEHERSRDVLLRRLAGEREISFLKVFAGLVEPVKGYQRGGQQRWTTLGPLTHLVDAVSVDNPRVREVRHLLDRLLNDAPRFNENREWLRVIFGEWRQSVRPMRQLIERAPALREVEPLVTDLEDLAALGDEALMALSINATPLPEWRDRMVAILDRAARPKAALEFPLVPLMRELVFAAMSQAEARAMSLPDWRQHVRTLAAPPRRGRGY